MTIGFKRCVEMEMAALELADGTTTSDVVAALSGGQATFAFDQKEGVFVIKRSSDRKELGWFQEIQQTAADAEDREFVAIP